MQDTEFASRESKGKPWIEDWRSYGGAMHSELMLAAACTGDPATCDVPAMATCHKSACHCYTVTARQNYGTILRERPTQAEPHMWKYFPLKTTEREEVLLRMYTTFWLGVPYSEGEISSVFTQFCVCCCGTPGMEQRRVVVPADATYADAAELLAKSAFGNVPNPRVAYQQRIDAVRAIVPRLTVEVNEDHLHVDHKYLRAGTRARLYAPVDPSPEFVDLVSHLPPLREDDPITYTTPKDKTSYAADDNADKAADVGNWMAAHKMHRFLCTEFTAGALVFAGILPPGAVSGSPTAGALHAALVRAGRCEVSSTTRAYELFVDTNAPERRVRPPEPRRSPKEKKKKEDTPAVNEDKLESFFSQ
jgi:hypothetical protein